PVSWKQPTACLDRRPLRGPVPAHWWSRRCHAPRAGTLPTPRLEPAEMPCRLEKRLGGGFGIGADRSADQHIEQHEGAGDAEYDTQFARHRHETADRFVEPHDLDDA